MLQIIILGLATLALSSYGSPDTEGQSPKRFQDIKEQWVSEIQMSSLRELTLSGCSKLTDEALTHIARLKDLEYLDISNCPGFTDEGKRAIRAALLDCLIVL